MRLTVILSLALALGGIVGALYGGGPFLLLITQLAVIPTIFVWWLMSEGKRTKLLMDFDLVFLSRLMIILGFWGGGVGIYRYREREMRSFVQQTLPLLDDYKKKHGHYPSDLAAVTNKSLPYYLRNDGGYFSNGAYFSFYYNEADSILSSWQLTDYRRYWMSDD